MMKQKLKIIALFIVCIVSIFYTVIEVSAVSYGGSSTFSMPSVGYDTGATYDFCTGAGCNDGFTFYYQFTPEKLLFSKLHGAVINSGSISFSGVISVTGGVPGPASDCRYYSIFHTYLKQVPTGTGKADYFYEVATGYGDPSNIGCQPITIIDTKYLFSLDLNTGSCPGLVNECVIFANPHFISSSASAGLGIYLHYVDIILYTNKQSRAIFTRYPYSGNSGIDRTIWQSSLNWLFLYDLTDYSTYGLRIFNNFYIPNNYSVNSFGSPGFGYKSHSGEYLIDDTTLTQFLSETTGTNLNTTLPNWLGASSLISSESTGSTETGSGYFDSCGTVDIGCYLKGYYNGIKDGISQFFTQFMPDFGFSGNFDSCGSFASGTTQTTFSKFTNIIALINPFPPANNTEICTIFGSRTIVYGVMWPEENFFQKYIPGQLPQLEIDPHFIFGQTIVDIVTIFSMMYLIFYKKTND